MQATASSTKALQVGDVLTYTDSSDWRYPTTSKVRVVELGKRNSVVLEFIGYAGHRIMTSISNPNITLN